MPALLELSLGQRVLRGQGSKIYKPVTVVTAVRAVMAKTTKARNASVL